MKEQQINFMNKKGILTLEEVRVILDYIVDKGSLLMDPTKSSKQNAMLVASLCDKFQIPYMPFYMNQFGMDELDHYFGITGFETEKGPICFLIDLSYIKFAEKFYNLNSEDDKNSKLVHSPGLFISDEMKTQLLDSKYITLTDKNFEEYISGFIDTYRLANSIDERNAYDKIYELLQKYDINLVDNDYLNSGGKTY